MRTVKYAGQSRIFDHSTWSYSDNSDSTNPGTTACGKYLFDGGSTVMLACSSTPFTYNVFVSLSTVSSSASPSPTTAPPTSTSSSTASQTATPAPVAGSQGLSTGAIVGIAIGCGLLLLIGCLIAYWIYRRRKARKGDSGDPAHVPLNTVAQGGDDRDQNHIPTSHHGSSHPAASAVTQHERENGFGPSQFFPRLQP